MAQPIPGSLSEGAAERSEAEGVSSDGSTGPMVYPPPIINSVIFERLRSSKYTPSVSPPGCQLPQRGSREGAAPFNRVLANIRGFGRFSSPLRKLKNFYSPPFNGRHSLSHAVGRDSSLREGAGVGLHHSTGYSLNRGGAGDFHRPYGTQKFLHSTIHRSTLPQSRQLGVTAPSGREPGWACTIQPGACETVGFRAIFIAPTGLRSFYISPFNRAIQCQTLRIGRWRGLPGWGSGRIGSCRCPAGPLPSAWGSGRECPAPR